jgi:plasmid stability protein
MSKTIQIRDIPEQVHRTLKARAALEGISLSDFIKRELQRSVQQPTMQEWLNRSALAKPISTGQTGAQIIRELRGT